MMSFFKKETKEDKERRKLERKKHGEVSFNTTVSSTPPDNNIDVYDSTEIIMETQTHLDTSKNETHENLSYMSARQAGIKLQSNSKSSLDSQQHSPVHPQILPKPKKGILKTMSKFGIGPTLSNLSGHSNNNLQPTQPQVLINTNTNAQILSSPKQQMRSTYNGQDNNKPMNSIESSVTNYSKRNSQVLGHNLNRSNSKSDSDSFLLPSLRKLPEFLTSEKSGLNRDSNSEVLNALIRCVNVPVNQINQIDFIQSDNNRVLVVCNQSRLPFLPGDELLSINEQLVNEKSIADIKQMLNTYQNEAMSQENKSANLPIYVRTSLECSELIVKNTCTGMLRIQHADPSSLNLMNSTYSKASMVKHMTSLSNSSIGSDSIKSVEIRNDSAWLIHTKGYSLVKIISKISDDSNKSDCHESVKFKVRLENGNMIEVNEEDLEKINPSKYDFCEDLSQLQFINESSLIHTIRQRYETMRLRHSYIGSNSLLVIAPELDMKRTASVNELKAPFYNDKIVSVFKGCKYDEMPPHIYSYAQSVYRNMLSTRQDQSIVLMGHTGSAKTTNAKYILNYLFKIASQVSASNSYNESKLNSMFVLLNAFCSVQTDKNLNGANRFVNIFLLEFNHSGQIASILLQLISLDYTRLLYQSNNESNFLIFYYILFGADSSLKSELQIENASITETGNNLFFQSNRNGRKLENISVDHFKKVMSAFEALNFKESEIKAILSIIAAIVLLGQAGAMQTNSNSRNGQFNNPNDAHRAANLLGVSFQQLNDNIFCNVPSNSQNSSNIHTKYGHLSNNGSSKVSPDTGSQPNLTAVECLEGFCLGLYQEVLNLLTNFINRSFKSTTSNNIYQQQQSISNSMLLIDPPGFQYQETQTDIKTPASYSDLMCNYLSERLQLMFYQINFINPIEKCAQEGLDVDLVEHIPESPSQLVNWFDKPAAPAILNRTVNTIQSNGNLKTPVNNCGLLWLLEEQISSSQKSAALFMKKLIDSDQKQNFLSIKNNSEPDTTKNFTIHHQFGQFPVEYNVNTWIEQYCKEYIMQSNAMLTLTASKKDHMIVSLKHSSDLLNQSNVTYQSSHDSNKPTTFSLKRQASVRKMLTMSKRKTFNVNFKLQLDSIFDSMRRTKCNFVFCVLPSNTTPNDLSINLLRGQLKAHQILAACRIYRQGYPENMNLEDFERKFSMFSGSSHNESVLQNIAGHQDNHKKTCLLLINALELDASLYKFGITQIFFKAGVLSKLDDQRDKKLNNLIIRLQSNCRRYLAQKSMEKKKIQDSAIKCLQKNIRISFSVKKWKWWRLYTQLMPIINVQNTETLFKQCKEELDEFKRKNERLNTEKNNLMILNHQLEGKLMNLQTDYVEEHSANAGTVELYEAESAERQRLEVELTDLKPKYHDLKKKHEQIEAEMLEMRLQNTKLQIKDELENETPTSASSHSKELDTLTLMQIEKLKYENETLKKQLAEEKENENIFKQKERNFFENKLKDKDNELIEVEKQTAIHKRKYQKLCEELQDTQRLCDNLKVRNNELEKIQRKFDTDTNTLKNKFETEKESREKSEREREILKFELQTANSKLESEKMEKSYLTDKCERLERDLKEYESAKYDSITSSSTTGTNADQFIKLKSQIRDMETKINDQENELDDQQGVIQQLEQTKLRLQMQAEKEKSKWQREIAEKESEMDDLRFHTQKKIKAIEMQLEEESEISSSLQREKRELERKLKEFSSIGKKSNFMLTINSNGDINGADLLMNNGSSIGDYITKIKRQMQKYKMLAIDAQTQLEKIGENIPKQSILKALKSQLEDSEISKANALKAKQILNAEVNELQSEIEDNLILKQNLEEQNMHLNRDLINMRSQLEEQERDTDELLKKYQNHIQTSSLDSHHFIDLNNQIDVITIENRMLKEKIREHEDKISIYESTWVEKTTFNKIESKIRDLEYKLDLEVTHKTRIQTQLERVKQQHEKAVSQTEAIISREKKLEDTLKKSQRQNKDAIEEFSDVQKKVIDLEETKKRLEQQNEILEKELETAKNEIRVNLHRLDAFQNAFNAMNDEIDSTDEIEDTYDDEDDDGDDFDQSIPLTCE